MRNLLTITATAVTLIAILGFLKFVIIKTPPPKTNVNDIIYSSDTTQKVKVKAIKQVELPTAMLFAGEKVPLEKFDVREKLERELTLNTFWYSNTIILIKRANRYMPYINSVLEKNGVPEDMKYIVLVESGFLNATSPAKAVGFWQFLETTAKEYGLEITKEVDERYNWKKSTEAACKYLLWLKKHTGSWTLAGAAYNCGRTALNRFIKRQGVGNYFDLMLSEETERYLFRIFAFKLIINHPLKYGYNLSQTDLYPYIETTTITIDKTIPDIAKWAKEHNLTYKDIKYFNPWLRENTLTIAKDKKYEIELPLENYREIY